MEKEKFSYPVSLRRMQITDKFWKNEMELVRTEVIPYQWNALNDKVEGAAPSYCMHNFKVAAEMNRQKRKQGAAYKEPSYTYRGFEMLPEDPENLKDEFYGYVFQDTDFSKWVEAVGYSLTQHPDPDLEKVADAAIDIVCAAQQEDGYLDTYYIINGKDGIFTNLRDHHELYCMGHLIEGAVAYYEATGKDKLLHAAERFADYATDYFGPEEGKCKGYPGHEIAEMALVRLWAAYWGSPWASAYPRRPRWSSPMSYRTPPSPSAPALRRSWWPSVSPRASASPSDTSPPKRPRC